MMIPEPPPSDRTSSGTPGGHADADVQDDGVSSAAEPRGVDGDVSTHLEELLVGQVEALPELAVDREGLTADVELVGPHLRIAGTFFLGRFRRLSDFLNHQQGLMKLHNCTVLRRNGEPTRVTAASVWVSPAEVTIIGSMDPGPASPAAPEFRIHKRAQGMIFVTPGHTLTGEVYIPHDALVSAFIESSDPAFIPLTDVRTRSLADRRIISRYGFAILNRGHIVAATELLAGMVPRNRVL
jgi:hypothetical protein